MIQIKEAESTCPTTKIPYPKKSEDLSPTAREIRLLMSLKEERV